MMLSELMPNMKLPVDLAVSGITDDSRRVNPGDLFVAVPGLTVDGRRYIGDAIDRRAAAVLCEPPMPQVDDGIPIIEVPRLSARKGEIASRFYGEPSTRMLIVAVTGTNGKTSCSQFLAAALSTAGCKCGVIGTLGFGTPGALEDAGLTTPDAIGVQSRLSMLLERGCEAVCLEASSHGLSQGRLNGTAIDVALFTNISRDHLDYHDTFGEYKNAKALLFRWQGLKGAVVNIDDPFGVELAAMTGDDVQCVTYSIEDRSADVHSDSLVFREDGFDAEVVTPWGAGAVSSALLGRFNVGNLLAVVSVLGLLEYDITDVLAAAGKLETVPGRMEAMRRPGAATVVIDYAHTPDALEKALDALKLHCRGELWCVFGCGGDRDVGKRPLMGRIAERLADHVVVTDDNPRTEPSEFIIQQIVGGMNDHEQVQIDPDRESAIRSALSAAGEHDIVLIAGKGHEDYQEVNGVRKPFSDYEVVRRILGEGH